MPTPDTVAQGDGPTCPPSGCTQSAICNACYVLFDYIFNVFWSGSTGSGNCQNYTLSFSTDRLAPGQGFSTPFYQPCWTAGNYDCPYDTFPTDVQCFGEYSVGRGEVIWNVSRVDGCAVTTITIKYNVRKECNNVLDPILGDLTPETTYEHKFIKTHCDCSDVFGVIPFDSTTSTNNAAGITVPDVCNAEGAIVEITDDCLQCPCYDCDNPTLISVTGPSFNGTIAVGFNYVTGFGVDRCAFEGVLIPGDCPDVSIAGLRIFLDIKCDPCEKYDLLLIAEIFDDATSEKPGLSTATFEIKNIACGESGVFDLIVPLDPANAPGTLCGLKDHVFSVSSL
jgi:hypothetical protein